MMHPKKLQQTTALLASKTLFLPTSQRYTMYDPKDHSELSFWLIEPIEFLGTIVVALLLTIARKRIQILFSNLADKWQLEEKRKFGESCWKNIFYITSWITGAYIMISEDWFPNTRNCWDGVPNVPKGFSLRLFYLYQLGFYVHSLYAHLVLEVRRSDFIPLLIHHIVTFCLIYFSYILGYHRVGLLILVVHDCADITLESAKLSVYLKQPTYVQNPLYVLLVLTWVISRLYIFPKYLINCTWYEAWEEARPLQPGHFFWPFNFALFFLQALHVYWFVLILKVGWNSVLYGYEDVREAQEAQAKKLKKKQ